jgi:hypothetical protein
MKNKEELPTNSDRGALQPTSVFRLENRPKPLAKLLRPELTDPASGDQPALSASSDEALMEVILAPRNLERAWRQVKGNRGAPAPDGMTIKQFEAWARENWPAVREQLLEGTYQPAPVRRKSISKEGGRPTQGVGARLRLSPQPIRPRSHEASSKDHPARPYALRRRRSLEIFRPSSTRRFNELREPQGSRWTLVAIDRPLLARGCDGGGRVATDRRRHATGWSAFTHVVQHPVGRLGQGIGTPRSAFRPLCGRLHDLREEPP